ncbi:MAG: xanthine dehydrogenase family protein molybdopterin-binding subunit [Chloroflexi bacterium]|nr:xanthine dehydrogenase family protein molybdopterin-binding subunit [Chloroflexota bacterium]
MTTRRATGTPLPRVDGAGKVTGSARYSADVEMPNALWGRVLRSPHPYARITAIDTTLAAALPGVHAVLTGADVRGAMTGRRIFDIPLIADDTVRFVGDIVAAVAADDSETADRALALIDVTYEDLTPIFDPVEAASPSAKLLHPNFNDYTGSKPLETPSNVFVSSSWGTGDTNVGFAESDVIIEGTYTTAMMHQAYMETHTCLVSCRDDGQVDIWASNKGPHGLKRDVAQTTDVDPESIHIHHTTIGGDFGGKGGQMNIPIAYFLSRAARQPVLMVMDYREELTAANPRHPSSVHVRSGVKNDGTILATDIVATYDSGAYAGFLPLGFLPGPRHCIGPYHIPHARVTAHHVYTNRVPAGHMRGPGEPQTIFAMESHVDVMARQLRMDPADMRRKNVIRAGDINGLGEEYHDLRGLEAFEAALESPGYGRERGGEGHTRSGIGVGMGERAPGGGETHAAVTFTPDGSVVIHTSIFEQGSGTYTILTQMASDILGVDPGKISVAVWDTDETGYDSGAGASRNTRMASEAVTNAAIEARDALFRLAAELEGWSEEGMSLTTGGLVRAGVQGATPLSDLLSRTDASIGGAYDYKDMAHAHVTAFTIHVAEVTVDLDTGQVVIDRLTAVADAGQVLNPIGHDGQVRGGAIQGMGYGVMEEIMVSDGVVGTQSLADYKVPTFADMPEFQSITLESEGGVGPFNIKGIGENSFSPMAPAIANAVADACGIRITDLPITAEKVYRALHE